MRGEPGCLVGSPGAAGSVGAMSGTSGEAIVAVVRRVLSVRGPMAEDDLLGVLDADGIDLGPDPDVMLADVLDQDAELVMPLADERWAWIPAVLGGRIFTHRLSAVEAAHDILAWDPDLAPLSMLTGCENYRGSPTAHHCGGPLLDGDVLAARGVPETAVDGDGVLLLQPGRFTALGVAAGDLVGLRVTAHGFELAAVQELTPCDIGAALAALLEQRPDRPEMLDVAVCEWEPSDDGVFREPAAPLGELLSASGLTCDGDWVARSGFDFDAWRVAGRIETIKERYQLDDDEALAVLVTVRLYEQILDVVEAVMAAQDSGDEHELAGIVAQLAPRLDPTPSEVEQEQDPDRMTVRATLEFLTEPAVAAAVLAETSSEHDHSAIGLGVFAESAEPLAPRERARHCAGCGPRPTSASVTSSRPRRVPTPRSRWIRPGR